MGVFRRDRPAAVRRQRHGHVAPMRFAADPQFVFEHYLCIGHVAITFRDLLERRREKRRVARMTEHAMLLVNESGRLGLRKRCATCCQ
jgi:hypothetical protein